MPNTTPQQGPREAFPSFYDNAIIGVIADVPRWTVSDKDKMPINMRELMKTGRIWGAHEITDRCLVTLDEMVDFLPDAANNAFHLRAQSDGFLVLDIEKTCPPETAQKLLRIPSLYSELSMSGKGYHLILPLPANFWQFPIATGKKVLQHELGHYEILLEHWVTFTRTPIPQERMPSLDFEPGLWEELYESLASKAVESPAANFDLSAERPAIPRREQIITLMTRRPMEKTVDDFHGDHSRFEFSVLGQLYNRMLPILPAILDAEPDAVFDPSAKSWLIYEAATQILPYREKHDETRNGLPLLLNSALDLVARRIGDQNAKDARS